MTAPSLDGRWFAPAADPSPTSPPGGGAMIFRYGEEDGEVWATYVGGPVRRGYLVGVRRGDLLAGHYIQLDESGETSSGRCSATISVLPDGRLRLTETWQPATGEGATTSVAEEIAES
ncbi:MAG: hypothetical protein HY241_06535 [Actinobacteria bacterium]|nr:hypothetical protein [Actinomycetota bacterium]